MSPENLPLTGIRVLDFSWILAGPFATAIMADFGAEVIKIQSRKVATGTEQNNTPYFAALNRNKLGITLDMDLPQSRELFLELVQKSDIVVQNFTPRVMHNWGLDYKKLKAINPAIIVVSLSGMGTTGPWRNFAALADTIEALSGLTSLSSYDQDSPVLIGYPHSDIVAGLFALLATLAALEQRNQTGKGTFLDISEYESMCALMGPALLDFEVNQHIPMPEGNSNQDIDAAPYGCYRCRGNDRLCVISISSEEEWQELCKIMHRPDWLKESQFSTLEKRNKNKKQLDKYLERWTKSKSPETVMRLLQGKGIPCSVVNNISDLTRDRQLKFRDFYTQYEHPVLGAVRMMRTPIKMSGTRFSIRKSAPLLGEDNRYVFKHILGLDEKLIDDYIKKGVIR